MNRYFVHTKVRLIGTFTDAIDGVLSDPTTVALTITPPPHAGVGPSVVTPTRDSVGLYHYDVVITSAGIWMYQWQGDGALIAASPVNLLQAF